MKSEPHDTSGPGRRRPGQAAALTAWLTVIGLMVMGVLALLLWPFGLLPDVSLLPVGTALIAGGGVVGSDRERPRRWVPAAAAGICVVAATATLGATVARLVSPPAADLGPHVGIILGFPPAAAVFTWVGNLGNPPAPPAAAGPDA
ncbi:hypothetical protein [Actinacidiphila glaucinigra]|uniref:hypothetical protein n=2 Tax=Streptomycetaceae TaxID=2062 RepID=UPI003D8DE7D3